MGLYDFLTPKLYNCCDNYAFFCKFVFYVAGL